jgi:ABC-type polysaccharide/polyol phosphate transport system ATPase subunit
MTADTPAIRMRDIGRYFGPPVEMDGANEPREAFRSLMRIAGVRVAADAREGPRVTQAVAGHVLRNVTLDIARGSVVCLTGSPGSGKSVLLKILAGVIAPTSGTAEIFGPVTALLSINDNVDQRKTAYENIQASPYVQTASSDEAARYAAEVLAFAEIEEFEHAALRTFSTGMVLRLSVALALCGRPSIVLIDDVMAVGDIGFQQRCFERVRALKEQGCTLVLAFSDEMAVRQLATRVLTLASGQIVSDTPPERWRPSQDRSQGDAMEWQVLSNLPEDDVMALRGVTVAPGHTSEGAVLDVSAVFEPKSDGLRCRPLMTVAAAGARSALFRSLYPEFVALPGRRPLGFTVQVPAELLPNGDYVIGFHMVSCEGSSVYALKAEDAVKVTVKRDEPRPGPDEAVPLLRPTFTWEVERLMESGA